MRTLMNWFQTCHTTIIGKAQWYKIDPANHIREINIGLATYFTVWITANPYPEADEWHWRFFASEDSVVQATHPDEVFLTVKDEMARLDIRNVTMHHNGTYTVWTRNRFGGWQEGDLKLYLFVKCKNTVNFICTGLALNTATRLNVLSIRLILPEVWGKIIFDRSMIIHSFNFCFVLGDIGIALR